MRTERRSHNPGASVSKPTLPRARAAVESASSMPSIEMRPASGRINPASIRIVVVLPAPFGPSSVTISPAFDRQRHVAHGDARVENPGEMCRCNQCRLSPVALAKGERLPHFEIALNGLEKNIGDLRVAGFRGVEAVDADIARHVCEQAGVDIDQHGALP